MGVKIQSLVFEGYTNKVKVGILNVEERKYSHKDEIKIKILIL